MLIDIERGALLEAAFSMSYELCVPDLLYHQELAEPPRRLPGRRRIHRYRWMTGLPVRDGDDALHVNWLEIVSARPGGELTGRLFPRFPGPITSRSLSRGTQRLRPGDR